MIQGLDEADCQVASLKSVRVPPSLVPRTFSLLSSAIPEPRKAIRICFPHTN